MTTLIQLIAILLTAVDVLVLLALLATAGITIFYHVTDNATKEAFHAAELAKILGILSCALSLAVMICWGAAAVFSLHDAIVTMQHQLCNSMHVGCTTPTP